MLSRRLSSAPLLLSRRVCAPAERARIISASQSADPISFTHRQPTPSMPSLLKDEAIYCVRILLAPSGGRRDWGGGMGAHHQRLHPLIHAQKHSLRAEQIGSSAEHRLSLAMSCYVMLRHIMPA